MTYVGIDVSKATFVVAYSSAKNSKTKTFKNTTKGVHIQIKSSRCFLYFILNVANIYCLFFVPFCFKLLQ